MTKKKKPFIVRRENWKGKYVYIIRNEKGQIQKRKDVKKTKYKKPQLQQLYNKYKTFTKGRYKKDTNLTNVKETVIEEKTNFETSKKPITSKPRKKSIYQVSGYYNNIYIAARSSYESENHYKDAWENFLLRISQADNPDVYDEDSGIDLVQANKVKNIKEGWVYYSKK